MGVEEIQKMKEEIRQIAPLIDEIEMLEEKIFKQTNYEDRDSDKQRIETLKKNIGDNAPVYEIMYLDGRSQLFARTPLRQLFYKVSHFLDTIVPCVSFIKGNTEITCTTHDEDQYDDVLGKITLYAINNESTLLDEMENWSEVQWYTYTLFYTTKNDTSI